MAVLALLYSVIILWSSNTYRDKSQPVNACHGVYVCKTELYRSRHRVFTSRRVKHATSLVRTGRYT
jgi:hypothetical protein